MADYSLAGTTARVLFEKLLSHANENIGLVLGFKKDVETLRESLKMIQDFLADAQEKQLNDSVKRWLEKLEGVAYEADNVFDELNYEMLRREVQNQNQQPMREKVCFFFSFCHTNIAFRWRIASKIRDINLNLKKINDEANSLGLQSQLVASAANTVDRTGPIASRETDSFVGLNVVGRANDASKIVELLLSPSAEVVSFLPIIGMGGLGKTTLAKLVYNDKEIQKHFDKRIWVCVSDKSFDDTRLFKLILESLTRNKVDLIARDAIVQEIKDKLVGKTYFLVLDDVWEDDREFWSKFLDSLNGISTNQGNWSIVTTRKVQVSSNLPACRPLHLEKLADDDCWSIVEKKAFSSSGEAPIEMEEIRKKVTTLCQGLPLAARVIGGLLSGKAKGEWLSIIDKELSNVRRGDNDVMWILKLSFDHLPSPCIKKCFAYCSLFSKYTDIDKEELIQLWMAEGFLQPNLDSGKMMEEIGDDYLNILLQSSLLQEGSDDDDEDGSKNFIRMHDLVHDLAQSVSKSEMINLRDGVRDGVCHARYIVADQLDDGTDTILKEASSSIRTLFAEYGTFDGKLLQLKYLRTLTLSWTETEELPSSINKLIHLRFLNVYGYGIRALPESLCKLYHLQTLRIERCRLKEFPKSTSNLISLRHLYFYSTDREFRMPKGVGKLTCLQTLQFFNVSREEGRQINELGGLKNLRGGIEIRNLELVNDEEDAEGANLVGKANLLALKLEWSEDREANNCDEDVLKGLQPHPNLQELTINNFMGNHFPSWLMNMAEGPRYGLSQGTVIRLVRLKLENCKGCTEIPALGHLPFLERLELSGLWNITCIGTAFYGTSGTGTDDCTASGIIKIFPALKSLLFEDMPNLIEWRGVEETTLPTPTEQAGVFPKLEELAIRRCPKLTSANPNLLSLALNECPALMHVRGWSTSLRELDIRDCDHLSELPEDLFKFCSLEKLSIESCPKLKSIQIPIPSINNGNRQQHQHRLRRVKICCCQGLISVRGGECELAESSSSNANSNTSSLEHLALGVCPNLEYFGVDVEHAPSLSYLGLCHCPKLRAMPKLNGSLRELRIGPFSEEFDDWSPLSSLSSVTKLDFTGHSHWESLPRELQHLTSLTELRLYDFGIEALPDWFGDFVSLEELSIWSCPKLKSIQIPIPSINNSNRQQHQHRLRRVEIWNCEGLISVSGGECELAESSSSNANSNTSSLEHLDLYGCPNLEYFGVDVEHAPSLSCVELSDCPKLRAMPKLSSSLRVLRIGPLSEEFEDWSPLSSLSSLTELIFTGHSHWESLPRELQHLTSLTELELTGFGIEALPDWFGDFVSLRKLELLRCKKLRYLPSAAAMSNLTKLIVLTIRDCPLLKERCRRASSSSGPDDSEWSKISHIPNIWIDRHRVSDEEE